MPVELAAHTGRAPSRRSTDVDVAFAPAAAYRTLIAARDDQPSAWRLVLRRPAVVLLVIAVTVTIMATRRITASLLASEAAAWSFAVVVQMLIGGLIIASGRRRTGFAAALDLWFAGHLPYSVWLLSLIPITALLPGLAAEALIFTALVPSAWTAAIVAAFCREVLGDTPAIARIRAGAHFLLVWVIALSYVAWSAGGWFQVFRAVGGGVPE